MSNILNVLFDSLLHSSPVPSIKRLPLWSYVGHNECEVAFSSCVESSIWGQVTSRTEVWVLCTVGWSAISMFRLWVWFWKEISIRIIQC